MESLGLQNLDFKKTYQLHPAMKLLYRAIRRERNTKLTFSLVLMVIGFYMPYFKDKKYLFLFYLGWLFVFIALKILFDIIRTPRETDERLWHLLNKEPRQIVWVYSVTTQAMPFGFHLWDIGTMYFKLVDGDEITVNLPVKKLRMVSKFLNRLLPHASFGYSEERRAQFENDPKLLLK